MPLYSLGERRPEIEDPDDLWIAPDANIIGDIWLRRGANVWFGASLRGDNERIAVGQGSNIQENCVLHTDMGFPLDIGANCTIGHGVVLHGCRLGDQVLIGMGATVLNGAELGENCLVGANTLITEGKSFPAGSMIMGSPGKVVRELKAEEIAGLKASALHYVERSRLFRYKLSRLA